MKNDRKAQGRNTMPLAPSLQAAWLTGFPVSRSFDAVSEKPISGSSTTEWAWLLRLGCLGECAVADDGRRSEEKMECTVACT
jgi:hypothetical protein